MSVLTWDAKDGKQNDNCVEQHIGPNSVVTKS